MVQKLELLTELFRACREAKLYDNHINLLVHVFTGMFSLIKLITFYREAQPFKNSKHSPESISLTKQSQSAAHYKKQHLGIAQKLEL
jgi:hypothetical protein